MRQGTKAQARRGMKPIANEAERGWVAVVDKGGKPIRVRLAVGDAVGVFVANDLNTRFRQTPSGGEIQRGGWFDDDVTSSSSGWLKVSGVGWAINNVTSSLW